MRNVFVQLLMLLSGSPMTTAQILLPNTAKPTITFTSELVLEGFPAHSKKRNSILLVHENYSCCNDAGRYLIEIDPSTSLTISRIMLIPPGDSLDIIRIDSAAIRKKIQDIIASGQYKTMRQLDTREVRINSASDGKALNAVEVKPSASNRLIRIYPEQRNISPFDCAIVPPSKDSFVLKYNTFHCWTTENAELILLSYGFISAGSGCDFGPFYAVTN